MGWAGAAHTSGRVRAIKASRQFGLDALIRLGLAAKSDPREVVSDTNARYFGALLQERTLLPGDGATLATTRFEDWITQSVPR